MKQIGFISDGNKEYELAIASEKLETQSFGVLVRASGRSWTRQKNILVPNSQEARSWAEKQLKNGGLKIA